MSERGVSTQGSGKLRPILFISAAVLFVAAVAMASVTGYKYWSDKQVEHARTDAVPAARHAVESVFTYDFKTVDTELPKSADNLTPSFRKDYLKLIQQAIAPGAKEKQLTVQANATAAGVVSAERSHAVVLLYLNQVTTSKDSPQGTVTPSRVRVALDKDGGHWLVDAITPI
ncbi:Mce-associated membrane protein [Nocardia kruczakiae]|uniref:Mce-associated membrane protein n=1 Tax=Nocardia kruczakiae TaxID=261477 RepID=A0ABU1XJH8_9NOCA|nr:h domain protein [Nocardia kruczakiae]MDR7170710.1 Mce-associated membrane protein [Nocardia kruczakiae]